MAKYFEGTSTKERYQVGNTYSNARGDFRANEDGSFTKLGNVVGTTDAGKVVRDNTGGQVSRGSAGNADVNWYASGRDRANPQRHGETLITAASLKRDSRGNIEYDRDGNAVTMTAQPRPRSTGFGGAAVQQAAFSGARLRAEGWSGDMTEPQDLWFAGDHMRANPKFSNADLAEIRYSDIGGNIFGVANIGADLGHNLAYRMGPEYYNADFAGRMNILGDMFGKAVGSIPKPNLQLDLGSAIPSEVNEPDRRFHDGWVSYDEGTTWQYEGINNPWR